MTASRALTVAVIALYGAAGGLVAARFGRDTGIVLLIVGVVWVCWSADRAHDRIDSLEGRVAALERFAVAPAEAETTVMPAWSPPRTGVVGRYRHPGEHRR